MKKWTCETCLDCDGELAPEECARVEYCDRIGCCARRSADAAKDEQLLQLTIRANRLSPNVGSMSRAFGRDATGGLGADPSHLLEVENVHLITLIPARILPAEEVQTVLLLVARRRLEWRASLELGMAEVLGLEVDGEDGEGRTHTFAWRIAISAQVVPVRVHSCRRAERRPKNKQGHNLYGVPRLPPTILCVESRESMLVDGLRWAALLGAAHLPSPVRTTEPEMREQTRREAPCVPGWRNQRPLDEALAELRRMHADECRESEARFFHGEATSSEHGSRQLTTWHRFAFARPAPAAEVCSSRSVARGGAPSDAEHAITTSGVIDAYPPVPFRMDDLACVSQTPLFTREECAAVIAEAEAANSWRGDGQNRTFSHLSDPIFRSYIPILYTAHLSAPCSPPLSHPTCPTCPTSPHISSHLPTSPQAR